MTGSVSMCAACFTAALMSALILRHSCGAGPEVVGLRLFFFFFRCVHCGDRGFPFLDPLIPRTPSLCAIRGAVHAYNGGTLRGCR